MKVEPVELTYDELKRIMMWSCAYEAMANMKPEAQEAHAALFAKLDDAAMMLETLAETDEDA